MSVLLAPDVLVNASVAPGTPPERVAQAILGGKRGKPKTSNWVLTTTEAMLRAHPDFKKDAVTAQIALIRNLCTVVDVQDPPSDWDKALILSSKAAGLKRVVTDHPDLADTEQDGIDFVSSETFMLESAMPPPPPPGPGR